MAKKGKQAGGLLHTLLTNILLGANLAALAMLWGCCATTWMPPALHAHLSLVGLAFPVLLLLNLLFLPLWLLARPRMLVVPLVGVALCGKFVLDYFPLHLTRSDAESDLTLFTWNTHGMDGCTPDSALFLADYLLEQRVDVVCLQETPSESQKFTAVYDRLRQEGYSVQWQGQMAILSRYPILALRPLVKTSDGMVHSLCADLLAGADTLTVFNVHLESNKFSDEEKAQYGSVIHDPGRDNVESEARFLAGKLAGMARLRAPQVQHLLHSIDSLPPGRRTILCGDLNETPISYTCQRIGDRLQNSFRQGGTGVGVSYSEAYFPVRIDHAFHSTHWTCTDARIERGITVSDHYPLLARLKNKEN